MDEDEETAVPRGVRLLVIAAFAAAALSLALTLIDNTLKKQVVQESIRLREEVARVRGGGAGPAAGGTAAAGDDGDQRRRDAVVSDAGMAAETGDAADNFEDADGFVVLGDE